MPHVQLREGQPHMIGRALCCLGLHAWRVTKAERSEQHTTSYAVVDVRLHWRCVRCRTPSV